MSLALYVESRIKTVVLLSLNRHNTGGLEGRKAREQRVTAAQQSYDWRVEGRRAREQRVPARARQQS